MAKLTAADRKKLPKSDFGLPGKKGGDVQHPQTHAAFENLGR